ncbi:hypothetical protein EVAR_37305_1 [Eumeta japonica]|uniref:Uncharacterized protein n=1 Tax=Eumeta variegata TaxID=151549 RepID=A0A4C1WXY8_EUMVA|nr:hypothetical protein EVAR_37305_1 [Eumeta japonica]
MAWILRIGSKNDGRLGVKISLIERFGYAVSSTSKDRVLKEDQRSARDCSYRLLTRARSTGFSIGNRKGRFAQRAQ